MSQSPKKSVYVRIYVSWCALTSSWKTNHYPKYSAVESKMLLRWWINEKYRTGTYKYFEKSSSLRIIQIFSWELSRTNWYYISNFDTVVGWSVQISIPGTFIKSYYAAIPMTATHSIMLMRCMASLFYRCSNTSKFRKRFLTSRKFHLRSLPDLFLILHISFKLWKVGDWI